MCLTVISSIQSKPIARGQALSGNYFRPEPLHPLSIAQDFGLSLINADNRSTPGRINLGRGYP